MFAAAIIYIIVSVLLILASALIFLKGLHALKTKDAAMSSLPPKASSGELKNREEIIARLERQFRSSPSAEI